MLKKEQIENKCSDCLFLDAEITEGPEQSQLRLNISAFFNYQVKTVSGGKIAFAVRGGDLRLDLNNIEVCKFVVTSDFDWFVEKSTRIATKTNTKFSDLNEFQVGVKGSKLNGNLKSSKSRSDSSESDMQDETKYDSWQVTALQGSNPGWRFHVRTGGPYLEGNINNEEFAILKTNGEKNSLTVSFSTEQRHVFVELTEGAIWDLGSRDIRQIKVANLYLWHKVLKPLLMPYLSKVMFSNEAASIG